MMAEIFNNLDRQPETRFLAALEERNRESGRADQVADVHLRRSGKLDAAGDADAAALVEKEKLPLALKGASETLRDLFFANMSERAGKMLREEIAALGPVRLRDVDEAQADRRGARQGARGARRDRDRRRRRRRRAGLLSLAMSVPHRCRSSTVLRRCRRRRRASRAQADRRRRRSRPSRPPSSRRRAPTAPPRAAPPALAEAAQSTEARVAGAMSSRRSPSRCMLRDAGRATPRRPQRGRRRGAPRGARRRPCRRCCRKAPLLEIEAMVARCLREAFDEPRARGARRRRRRSRRCSERIAGCAQAGGFAGKIVLLADRGAGPGRCAHQLGRTAAPSARRGA